jgi:hypothetical protein
MRARRYVGVTRPSAARPAVRAANEHGAGSAVSSSPVVARRPPSAGSASRRPSDCPRVALAALIAFAATTASALSLSAPALAAAECPNEQFRVGYASRLPDCRAYEAVSPPDSQPYFETYGEIANSPGEGVIIGGGKGVRAAESGDRLSYFSTFAPSGSSTDGPFYLSTRSDAGWTTQNVVPPQAAETQVACLPYMAGWSSELENGVLADGDNKFSGSGHECGADEPELVPGEPRGKMDLFVRNNETSSYQLVNVTPVGVVPANATFQAGSSDLSRVVFDEEAKLTGNAPAGDDFYEWAGGVVRLLTVLPDGTPVAGELADRVVPPSGNLNLFTSPGSRHAVSADGSRVVFLANGDLFVRERPYLDVSGSCSELSKACTVQVDASQAGGSGGGGQFMGASADGAQIYFMDADTAGLTGDTMSGSGQNLYRFDVETGTLTDLTAVAHAQVLGVSGMGEGGSHVYFVSEGEALAPNATVGAPNLYVLDGGKTRFIATLEAGADSCDWELSCLTARVSRTGAFIGFDSVASLTSYPNNPAQPGVCGGGACQEIFLYDAAAAHLSCASCDPTGAPPTAPASIRRPESQAFTLDPSGSYLQRDVSDNGQVFFDTFDQLPGARNGQSNVFEYEAGTLHLLSSGTSAFSSFFYEANATGRNVFFVTAQPLTSVGPEGEYTVVDAREDGGFPPAATAPAQCSGEECLPPLAPAPTPAPPQSTLPGPSEAAVPTSSPARPVSVAHAMAKKLAGSLKACRAKHDRHKRHVCELQARRRYGPRSKRASTRRAR